MYHVREQAKHPFPVVSGRSQGRGGTQHIASFAADNTTTSCVIGPQRAVGTDGDPELGVFGSAEEKRETNAGEALMYRDYCRWWIIVTKGTIYETDNKIVHPTNVSSS